MGSRVWSTDPTKRIGGGGRHLVARRRAGLDRHFDLALLLLSAGDDLSGLMTKVRRVVSGDQGRGKTR